MMKEIYYRQMLTLDDLALTPFYFILILFFAYFIRNLIVGNDRVIKKYFIPGLIVKLFGAICVGLIYYFYYNGGDTTEYYNNALVLYGALSENPINFFKLLMAPNNYFDPAIMDYKPWFYFHRDASAYFFGKITGIFAVLGFAVYTPTALLIAAVSYIGIWSLYITFYRIYPELYKEFAIAVLFIPSVVFWGSGILKDCFALASAGLCVYSFYNSFIGKRNRISSFLLFLFSAYLCLNLKPYIIIALLPGLFFWAILYYRSKIQSAFIRFIAGPLSIVIALVAGYIAVHELGKEYSQYSIKGALKTAEIYQDWHTNLAETRSASGYSLGDIDGSTRSIVTKIPAAINVTLFRPYIFEVRNPVMLLSAIESMLMFIFTIRILWKTGIRLTIKAVFNNPTAFFCIFYSLFFAFCVGFTAYNFGALVRYKIPCIPFFVVGLYILNMQTIIEVKRNKRSVFKPVNQVQAQLNN
jgi:hypothetical protein